MGNIEMGDFSHQPPIHELIRGSLTMTCSIKFRLAFLLLLASSTTVIASEVTLPDERLKPFSAHYAVRWGKILVGDFRIKFKISGISYSLKYTILPKGIARFFFGSQITGESRSVLRKNTVVPLEYILSQPGGLKSKTERIAFDWKEMKVTNQGETHPWQTDLEPGTQDKLGLLISITRDLYSGKKPLHYRVPHKGKLRDYNIVIQKRTTLDTKIGKLKSLKLHLVRKKKKKRSTDMWVSADLNYIPLKVIHKPKSGPAFHFNIISVEGLVIPEYP